MDSSQVSRAAPGAPDVALADELTEAIEELRALVAQHQETPCLSDEEQLELAEAAMALLLKLRPPLR